MADKTYSAMASKATKILGSEMLDILQEEYTGMTQISLGQEAKAARDATILNFRVERVENGMVLSIEGKRYIIEDSRELTERVVGALVAQGFTK